MTSRLLTVKNLKTYFFTERGTVRAIDGVSFAIDEGETVGLVGETGCGKSVFGLSILRLVPDPPGRIVEGEVILEGEDLQRKTEDEMRMIRGGRIAMIFQEPSTSLNPVFTVGDQICESIMLHQGLSRHEANEKAINMLKLVGMPDPEATLGKYPHELSGGMQQRVMIAMALSCKPRLLIADEPTTSLDVTIQAQILELLVNLKKEDAIKSILLITHDLGVVAEMCNKVAVMYAGRIVEYGSIDSIFERPVHPYTLGLLETVATITEDKPTLRVIPGFVPDGIRVPSGCGFHPRCSLQADPCGKLAPELKEVEPSHYVACHHLTKKEDTGP